MNLSKNLKTGDNVLCDDGTRKEQGLIDYINDEAIRIRHEHHGEAYTFDVNEKLSITKIYNNHIKLDCDSNYLIGNYQLHTETAKTLKIDLIDGDEVVDIHHYQVIKSFAKRPISTMPVYSDDTEDYQKLPMLVTRDTWRPDIRDLSCRNSG
jgi:hypothetical protein